MTYARPFQGHTIAPAATSPMTTSSSVSVRMGTYTGTSTSESTPNAEDPRATATRRRERGDMSRLEPPAPGVQPASVTVPQSVLKRSQNAAEGAPADLPDDDDEDEEPDARH